MSKIKFMACLSLLLAGPLMAQEAPKAIVDVLPGNKIILYNDAFEEVGELTKQQFDALKKPLEIDGQVKVGILIQQFNEDEGLYQINLEGAQGMVWVEPLAFTFWPDRELMCPKSIAGQVEETQEDGTVGFGGC